jgi:hypothetical protein
VELHPWQLTTESLFVEVESDLQLIKF